MAETMNKIVVYFTTCSPPPPGGYKIYWRVAGSDDEYTFAGTFFTSPGVFYDSTNPSGTCYEGIIMSDCGNGVFGNSIPFTSCDSSSGTRGFNCIHMERSTEIVGLSVFMEAHASFAVASDVYVNYTMHSNFNTYVRTVIILNGQTLGGQKISYANMGETFVDVVINSITPTADATYNYIDCGA